MPVKTERDGKPMTIQAVKVIEQAWVAAFRKSLDAAQARELMRAVREEESDGLQMRA